MEHSKTIKPTILVLIMPVTGAHGHVYFPIVLLQKITYAITLKGAGFNILWESILGLSVLGGFFLFRCLALSKTIWITKLYIFRKNQFFIVTPTSVISVLLDNLIA